MVKKLTKYFFDEEKSVDDLIKLAFLVFVFSGFFGFIYEEIFYRIDLGYFVKRGTTFGPWIPIYGFGSIFISLLAYRFRKNPIVVFLIGAIISGIVEYSTACFCWEVLGIRLWDYNVEIWNWGNINGYICYRSVGFFAVSSLLLMYLVIPISKKIVAKSNDSKPLSIIIYTLGILFAIDIIVSLIV